MTLAVFHLKQNLQVRLGQLRGEKGSASPPRRRRETAGHKSKFENAQYPVDTADIWHFLICRYIEKDVKARPFPPRHNWKLCSWIAVWLCLAGLPAFGACLLFPAFMVVLYLHCACSGGPCLHLSRFTTSSCGVREKGGPLHLSLYTYK